MSARKKITRAAVTIALGLALNRVLMEDYEALRSDLRVGREAPELVVYLVHAAWSLADDLGREAIVLVREVGPGCTPAERPQGITVGVHVHRDGLQADR